MEGDAEEGQAPVTTTKPTDKINETLREGKVGGGGGGGGVEASFAKEQRSKLSFYVLIPKVNAGPSY